MLGSLLDKLGIRYEDMTAEERATYQRWSDTLAKPDPTVDDIRAFLKKEQARCDEILLDYDIPEKKRIYYQASSRLVRVLTAILMAPGQEREALEKQLMQMIQK